MTDPLGEASTRVRVNRLKKEDPEFFTLMLEWRDRFRENARNNWLDKPMKKQYRTYDGKLVKRYESWEELLHWITKLWYDDEQYEYAAL